MTPQEILSPRPNELDLVLADLVAMVIAAKKKSASHYGWVAACVIDPEGNKSTGINHFVDLNRRVHGERDAIRNYEKTHGKLPQGCTIVTTLSPCTEPMQDRAGPSCTHLINQHFGTRVYCGYIDPSQGHLSHNDFEVVETENKRLKELCKELAFMFLDHTVIAEGMVEHSDWAVNPSYTNEDCRKLELAAEAIEDYAKTKDIDFKFSRHFYQQAMLKRGFGKIDHNMVIEAGAQILNRGLKFFKDKPDLTSFAFVDQKDWCIIEVLMIRPGRYLARTIVRDTRWLGRSQKIML